VGDAVTGELPLRVEEGVPEPTAVGDALAPMQADLLG
jgi:hypothetical protein